MTLLRHPENPVNADNKADALEEAVSLIDELCALADDYVTNGGRPRLADLPRINVLCSGDVETRPP